MIILILLLSLPLCVTIGYFSGYEVRKRIDNETIDELEKELKESKKEISNLNDNNNLDEGVSVIKENDGQLFFVKPDKRSYCLLGKDKNGNGIETIVKDDECVITDEICSILLDEGTIYLVDNPKFLNVCK